MKKIFLIYLFLLICGGLFAQSTDPDHTMYVSPSYPNSNPYYATIQDAINNAKPRTIIYVYPAVYNEDPVLIDSVYLYLFSGVKIAGTLSCSDVTDAKVLGDGIIEKSSGTALYITNSSPYNGATLLFELREILSPTSFGIYLDFTDAENTKLTINCSKLKALKALSGQASSSSSLTTNTMNFSCDSMVNLDPGNTNATFIEATNAIYNFKVKYLWGYDRLIYIINSNFTYTGNVIENVSSSGKCIELMNASSATFDVIKVRSASSSLSAIYCDSSYLSMNIQDTLKNITTCLETDSTSTININAGMIVNTGNGGSGSEKYTVKLLGSGFLNATTIKNNGNDGLVYIAPNPSLLTLTAKMTGNNNFSGIITVGNDNAIIKDCVIRNNTTGHGVYASSLKNVRINGTLFTNSPKAYDVNYTTGSEVNAFYVK